MKWSERAKQANAVSEKLPPLPIPNAALNLALNFEGF